MSLAKLFYLFYYPLFRNIASYWDAEGNAVSWKIIELARMIVNLSSNDDEASDSDIFPRFKLKKKASRKTLRNWKLLTENKRMRTYSLFKTELAVFPLQHMTKDSKVVISYFSILTDVKDHQNNKKTIKRLNKRSKIKIGSAWRCYHQSSEYIKREGKQSYPVTENLSNNLIIIPCSPFYKKSLIKKTSSLIKEVFNIKS